MKLTKIYLIAALISLAFLIIQTASAQTNKQPKSVTLRSVQKKFDLDPNTPLLSRVTTTPKDVLKMFTDAGMSLTEHRLTAAEKKTVALAIATLPPLHQHVLKEHLKSISFLDNMPNTALTSPITDKDGINLYHITFRAGILHQNISDWVTEKERTCFAGGDSTISVSIQAGLLSALTYVLIHEGTHIVDGSLHLLSVDTIADKPTPNAFTQQFAKGIWKNINTFSWPFNDSLAVKSRFRPGGRRYLSTEAVNVYRQLAATPSASLYSTASWHEDLAELVTIYHLTKMHKQPFKLIVMQQGKQIFNYSPMEGAAVSKRLLILKRFYNKS